MLLANEGTISQNKMINMELKKLSFNMLPPNIFISSAHYKIYNNQILFGFCSINSINDETGERIEEAMKNFAEEKNFINVIGHLAINKISKQTCEILIKSCCFDSLGMNKTEMIFNLDEVYEKTKIIINGKRMFLPKIINKEKDENFEKQWINEYLGIDFYEDFFINIRTKNPTFLPLSASSKS
jgi:DNA polymerase III alpha subunit